MAVKFNEVKQANADTNKRSHFFRLTKLNIKILVKCDYGSEINL